MRSAAAQFEQFFAQIEADPTIAETLMQPDDPAAFIALVLDMARDRGLLLDAGWLKAAIERRRTVLTVGGDGALPPRSWLPTRAQWRGQDLAVDWRYLGARRLREPFFEETVARFGNKPFNRLLRYATPIGALHAWLQQHPPLPPAGFIFHLSRCGSTLVSQMLAAIPSNVVVSEASPIDTVVQARRIRSDLGEAQHADWLRWIIGALGQPRCGEQHVFVKLDSWHALALPLFRRAFPTVPWIFLYRDPIEILVSHLNRPGLHMVPGALGHDLFGLAASRATQTPETYRAEILGRICGAVLRDCAPGRALLVNYRQLPAALWTEILPHFGVAVSEADREAMAGAARYDAKSPKIPFARDRAAKQALATTRIRAAATTIGEYYQWLEALRTAP
jgi:hypothetical protein